MKVLLFGSDPIFCADLKWGFQELGHDVMVNMAKTANEFHIINDYDPDYIMTFGSPSYYLTGEILDLFTTFLKHSKAKYFHWDTDGITWANLELSLIHKCNPNYVFTVCPEMLELLQKEDIPSSIMPYAYSPLSHHPAQSIDELSDKIAVVGCAYPEIVCTQPQHYRTRSISTLVEPLISNGRRVDFWGDARHKSVMQQCFGCTILDEWCHRRCSYDKTHEIYSNCFINLVFQNHSQTITKRTYEILGSGGFILTYENEEIKRQFVPQKDLVISSSKQETIDIVEYYLHTPDAYLKVRENALNCAKEHTYKQRAKQMLMQLSQ